MSSSPTNSSSSPVASSPTASVNSPVATNTKHDPDISEFFKSGPVRVVSDPEGYHVAQLANVTKTVDGYVPPENKMLVLGDLFDYTLGAGPNANNFATDKLKELRNAKSHSFKSAKYCNDNKNNIKVLFGNRDLNKLKLMPLALVTDSQKNYVKWWEAESYENAAQQLVESIANNTYKWDIPTMTNWKPFWKPNYDTCKHWNDPNPRLSSADQNQNMSCLERFYLIFGVDCAQGTMSGQNTLFGVAKECGLYDKIFGSYQVDLNNLNPINNNYILNTTNPKLKDAAELAAALVFTVFADAFYGEGAQSVDKPFTDVLNKFFKSENTYYCAYAELDADLLVFSHGGMRDEFFKCDMDSDFVSQVYEDKILGEMVQKQSQTQEGGYVGTNATVLSAKEITVRINNYNSQMKSELIILINEYKKLITNASNNNNNNKDKPTAELLLNLVISAPYAAPYAAPEGSGSCFHKHASPIMPGLDHPLNPGDAYRAKPICAQGKTLYQFIGHFPLGFAPTIDKYTTGQDGHVSYAINLDVSNSLFGQFDKLARESIEQNYSYVEVVFYSSIRLELLSNISVKMAENAIIPKSADNNIVISNYNLLSTDLFNEFEPNDNASEKLEKFKTFIMATTVKKDKTNTWNKTDWEKIKKLPVNIHGRTKDNLIVATVANIFDVYVYNPNTKPVEFTKFHGGKSIHRHRRPKSKRTGKCRSGVTKLHVRTIRTLVRRCHPSMRKQTGKKLQKK